jgi:SAM-dependent methyltransferase
MATMTKPRDETAASIRQRYPGDGYTAFHAPRYASLLSLLDRYVTRETRLLDIGRSRLTELIHDRYGIPVDALGFVGNEPSPEGRNFWFDLNLAVYRHEWRADLPTYDVIVIAEVIEHLRTPPQFVLEFLRTLLAPAGRLIVQTPNAVALHKRLEMLGGRNPFEQIRAQADDPGHFREYTRREMCDMLRAAGYDVELWYSADYLDYRYVRHVDHGEVAAMSRAGTVLNWIYRATPPNLRPGQTVVARAVG